MTVICGVTSFLLPSQNWLHSKSLSLFSLLSPPPPHHHLSCGKNNPTKIICWKWSKKFSSEKKMYHNQHTQGIQKENEIHLRQQIYEKQQHVWPAASSLLTEFFGCTQELKKDNSIHHWNWDDCVASNAKKIKHAVNVWIQPNPSHIRQYYIWSQRDFHWQIRHDSTNLLFVCFVVENHSCFVLYDVS